MHATQTPRFERDPVQFDDNLTACAKLVEQGDPARFRTVMAAPVAARAKLFPLYAFNVEVSRAPWVTQEPMIAEMRLQWWRDALEEISTGAEVRRHEVVTPLAALISPDQAKALDQLVAVRRWDCYKDPFEDDGHLKEYLRTSSGTLMRIAAELLGGTTEAAEDAGYGLGVANWLRAIPELEAQKRIPLVDGTEAGVRALAQDGLDAFARAKSTTIERAIRPALWPATGADTVLKAAINTPQRVADGTLPEPSNIGFTLRAAFNLW